MLIETENGFVKIKKNFGDVLDIVEEIKKEEIMAENTHEFIIKEAAYIEWQKWLNQWKHQYNLKIHSTTPTTPGNIVIVLERSAKVGQ